MIASFFFFGVSADLLVCSALLKPGHVHVFERDFNSVILTRYIYLGKLDNRLSMARGNRIDTHFRCMFAQSGKKNISTVKMLFCPVRANISTIWKLVSLYPVAYISISSRISTADSTILGQISVKRPCSRA